MPSKPSPKWAYAMLVAILSFASVISAMRPAQSQSDTGVSGSLTQAIYPSTDTLTLTLGFASMPFKLEGGKPFTTIQIGDPKIVEAKPVSDHRFILQALAVGTTNIVLLDEKNEAIKNVEIVVNDGGPSRVEVLNKPTLSGSTTYRCWATGCQYVKETEFVPTKNVSKVINQDVTPPRPEVEKPPNK